MGLTNLIFLGLRDNSVSELSPLVANTELGEKNVVNVKGNLLNYPSIYTHIPTLQSRGVEVSFDNRTPTTPSKISGDNQNGTVGVALAQLFVVEVRDEDGSVFEGVPVTFTVTAGGGIVEPCHRHDRCRWQGRESAYAWKRPRHEYCRGQRRRNH